MRLRWCRRLGCRRTRTARTGNRLTTTRTGCSRTNHLQVARLGGHGRQVLVVVRGVVSFTAAQRETATNCENQYLCFHK